MTFRQIATPTDSMLWLDVKKLRARYMPVIEQLVAILMVETQEYKNRHSRSLELFRTLKVHELMISIHSSEALGHSFVEEFQYSSSLRSMYS